MSTINRISFALLLVCGSIFASAQCQTCTGDFNAPVGFYGSVFCIKANHCPAGGPPRSQPFLASENPGIVPEQHSGKLLVKAVLHNSPAEHAGIRPGDEILSINGLPPGSPQCSKGWSDSEGFSSLMLQRGSKELSLHVRTAPLISMIGSQSLALSSSGQRDSFQLAAPFTFGLRWRARRGYLEISQILPGSPADAAGLKVGETILSVNGIPVGELNGSYAVSDSDEPEDIRLETLDNTLRKTVLLRSRGIAQILSIPEPRPDARKVDQASLAEAQLSAGLK